MKTKLFTLGILLAVSLSLFAEENKNEKEAEASVVSSSLVGVVLDKLTGEPLTGVEVSIPGTNFKTYTDFNGGFTFKNIDQGDYSISASLISYRSVGSQKVSVNGGQTQLSLSLESVE